MALPSTLFFSPIAMHPIAVTIVRLLLWVFNLATLTLLTVVTYRICFHPLARIPGPRLAAVSNVWQARYVRDGRIRQLALTLHKKYGPVVRVGPEEVWVCDGVQGVRQIYGKKKLIQLHSAYLLPISQLDAMLI